MEAVRFSARLVAFIVIWSASVVTGLSEEARLVKDILYRSYPGKIARPVNNTSDTISVKYGLSLINILALNDAESTISLKVWERYNWKDQHLTWDPKEYGRVSDVRLPSSKIWTPDLTLYNAARKSEKEDALAVVTSDGHVLLVIPSIFHVTCSFRESHHQLAESCIIKIGSWTYDGFKMDLDFFNDVQDIDTNDYILKNNVNLLGTSARRNVKYYPCCVEPYIDLMFNLKFSREDDSSIGITFGVLVCLGLTSLCMFWCPPSFTARMSLGSNVLIGYILTLILSALLPPEGKILPEDLSDVLQLMITTCVMIGCSTVALILHARGRSGTPFPAILRVVFIDILSKVLCVECKRPDLKRNLKNTERQISQAELMQDLETNHSGPEKCESPDDQDAILGNIAKRVQQVSTLLVCQQRAQVNASEWGILAEVCDRIFFAVFTVVFLILLFSEI